MNSDSSSKATTFFSQFKHQVYKKGEIIIRADDSPLGIYYLLKGRVKQYAISKKGEETIVTIYKPGSFFPMSWAINNNPNNYYFEALTNIEVHIAPPNQVVSFVKTEADVMFDLLSRLYSGLEGMTERMTYLMGGSAYERLVVELLICIKRFGKNVSEGEHNWWEVRVSEKDLAAQSGMTRETVSREMKNLKEKKLVVYDKAKLIINDLAALQAELLDVY